MLTFDLLSLISAQESLHDTAWPRLAQRIDDLQWVEMDGSKVYGRVEGVRQEYDRVEGVR